MRLIFAFSGLSLLAGCASIVDGNKYPVQIDSEPRGAAYSIANQHGKVISQGTTPDMVTLPSNDGAFDGEKYTFKFSRDGYEGKDVILDSGMNGWMWGNLLLGGLIGSTVDLSTGAAFDLPTEARASLRELPPAPAVAAAEALTTPISGKSKEQRIAELMQQDLPYQEYMAKMRAIEAEPD